MQNPVKQIQRWIATPSDVALRWWIALALASIAIVGLDILTGPYIQVAITFVGIVGLAAWHLGTGAAVGFALALVACRFGIATWLDAAITPTWAAAANAGIRLLVLVGLAVLVAVLRAKRALTARVQVLEGLLPICAFCKKIRGPDGVWEEIEKYISQRSATQFTHGYCPTCVQQHFGKLFPARDP